VIERGSVEGRSFHRGAVFDLLPEASRVSLSGGLMSLVRKELIRPDQAMFAGDDGFRFVHALVQDAAYAAMAKELRADLHERYAAWLEQKAGERLAEYEEILGYHLERAYRYRAELGPVDEHGRALARRAAERLTDAAQRASTRGDLQAKVNLLSRALALLPSGDPPRLELMVDLGAALWETGHLDRAEGVLVEAIEAALALNDGRMEARARTAFAELRFSTAAGVVADLCREAERAIQVLDEAGDELGLARAWSLLASLQHGQGQSAAAEEAWERSAEHARRAGSRRDETSALAWLASVALWGPAPATDARRRCEEILERVKGDLEAEADVLGVVCSLRAIEGGFDDARRLHARRLTIRKELGLELMALLDSSVAGWVEMLAGDAVAAERILRPAYQVLEQMGATGELQVGSYLSEAVYQRGRYEEAERLAHSVEELDPTSIAEFSLARRVRAKAVARLGQLEEGERLAREAVALIDQTDFPIDRADARMDLAEVLVLAGPPDEAAEVLQDALRLHEQKGNLVSAERTRALLAELGT
jgi:tetratricopeptide (TPR) repeat protein